MLPVACGLAVVLAAGLDGIVGFEDNRLAASLGLLGTIFLGWPGLRLNAKAYHRRRASDLALELETLIGRKGERTGVDPAVTEPAEIRPADALRQNGETRVGEDSAAQRPASPRDGAPIEDLVAHLRSDIETESRSAASWSRTDSACLFAGYVIVLSAGIGAVVFV